MGVRPSPAELKYTLWHGADGMSEAFLEVDEEGLTLTVNDKQVTAEGGSFMRLDDLAARRLLAALLAALMGHLGFDRVVAGPRL